MRSGRENPGSSRISASSAAGTPSSSRRRPSSAYASQKRSSTAQRQPTAWRTRRSCPGETKCGMSTNGIVRPAKTTSFSESQRSISSSIPAHWSPSLESSTRCWSFRLLTWSITLSSPMSRVLRTLPARMRPVYYLGVCFPIAVVLELVHANPVLVFSAAALAVVPCAAVMGEATEAIAARTGPGIGGLLNVTFGNAPELIIAFFALLEGLQEVVKASIVGSIIGNILLVLGASMLLGGLRRDKQTFNRTAANAQSAMLLLALAALMSEILVGSITDTASEIGLSEFFIGVFVVAIVGNAAEHWVAVLVAVKNKMDLAVNIAIGSSAQIALFVAPVLVLLSFVLGPGPMPLVFNGFEIAAIFLGVLVAYQVTNEGESTWFEGVQLLALYVILGLTFYYA